MQKPNDFQQERIVARETPYQVEPGSLKGAHAGTGTLSPGRVVWIKEPVSASPEQPVSAYAEGIGIVSLEKQALFA